MPGFHKHNDANSYYFIPKRHGDFHTYQLEDEARDMVLATGKEDGDIVSWDIFYTLNDLELLYFKESGADPRETAPDPSAVDFDIVSELSAEKRCAFVERVLDHYELHEVDSEAFHRVVTSLEEASWETLKPIMVAILGNTPVPTDALSPLSYLANGGADVPLNRIETAAILHHIYHTLWTSDVGGLLKGYDGERVYVDDDFAYYLTDNGMWDSEDKSSVIHIDVPQAYTSAFPDDGYAGELLLSLVENLTLSALDEAAEEHGSRLLQTLAAGLGDDSDSALLIVPTSSVETTEDTGGVLDEISDSMPEFATTDETADT